jgi:xylan 1,4-beta-xylosidase
LHGPAGSFIGQKILSDNYTATTLVKSKESTASAGLAAVGDDKNIVTAFYRNNQLEIAKVKDGYQSILGIYEVPKSDSIFLQMWVRDLYRISFLYSLDGKTFKPLNETPVKATFLPPWDNPPRAGLVSKGNLTDQAVFEKFVLRQSITMFSGKIDFTTPTSIFLILSSLLVAIAMFSFGRRFYRKTRKSKSKVKKVREEPMTV